MLAESLIRQNDYAATIERSFGNGNGNRKEWEQPGGNPMGMGIGYKIGNGNGKECELTMWEWGREWECKKPFPIISTHESFMILKSCFVRTAAELR